MLAASTVSGRMNIKNGIQLPEGRWSGISSHLPASDRALSETGELKSRESAVKDRGNSDLN